jgi:hypothetical protein
VSLDRVLKLREYAGFSKGNHRSPCIRRRDADETGPARVSQDAEPTVAGGENFTPKGRKICHNAFPQEEACAAPPSGLCLPATALSS